MSIAPNVENLTIGRGKLAFDRKLDGVYQGMRDLGSITDFNLSISTEKLDHTSKRSGLAVKDKTVIVSMNPTGAFTLEECNVDNFAMTFMAETEQVVQAAQGALTKALTEVAAGYYYELDENFVGVWKLPHGTVTGGPFEAGETLSDGAGASGTVLRVDDGILVIDVTGGTFDSGATITGGTSTADAALTADGYFDKSDVVITQASTIFTPNVDYTVDSMAGMIFIMAGSTLAESTATTVAFSRKIKTFYKLNAYAESEVIGKLYFISDNATGSNKVIKGWSVSITPSGDTGLISDEWMALPFELEFMSAENEHPDSPFMQIISE
jgi:hypothetical protein